MGGQEEQGTTITNEDIYDAFESGRQLMQGCEIRPETPEDEPEKRTEWRRGSIAPNLFCQATSGTSEERALKMWKCLMNLNG